MEFQHLYLIKLENEFESFYKIGTSVHRYCRFYQIMKHGYRVTIVYMLMKLDCYDAMNMERKLYGLFKHYRPLIKFGGHTECYKYIDIEEYKKHIKHLIPKSKEIVENLEITWR